jgi:glycosyltransferase involved in cell wall biosynthesis
MFELDTVAPFDYRDPWLLPISHRLRQLAQGNKRVAYFYERADNSTFRYRVYNMVQVLNAQPHEVSASYFFLDDLAHQSQICELADLLVICRTRYDARVAGLIATFRSRGKRVLFDSDDLVFNPDYAHLLISTLDLDARDSRVWDDWFAYTSRLGATLRQCDGGIATNRKLADQMMAFSELPATVIPNFLNREQLDISDQLYKAKSSLPLNANGLTHLGYFSGSPSHNRDFAMVIPALEALLDEDDSLGIVVVGYIEPGPALSRFGNRVLRFPFQDYVNLQRLIASVEYNLMPLQFNIFTNCKSELKYFDAAVVGTPSIASPTATYQGAIQHGENGYLAQAHQWYAVLKHVLAERGSYSRIAANAQKHARNTYAWTTQRKTILAALDL